MNKLIPAYLPDRDKTIIANKIKASYDEEVSKLKEEEPKVEEPKDEEPKDEKPKDETILSDKAIKSAVSKISSGMRNRAKKVGILSPEKFVKNIFKKQGKQPLSKPDNVRRRYLNLILKVERDNQDNALGLDLKETSFEDKLQSIQLSLLSKDIITK